MAAAVSTLGGDLSALRWAYCLGRNAAWPELRVEDFSDPGRVSALREAEQAMYRLLPAAA